MNIFMIFVRFVITAFIQFLINLTIAFYVKINFFNRKFLNTDVPLDFKVLKKIGVIIVIFQQFWLVMYRKLQVWVTFTEAMVQNLAVTPCKINQICHVGTISNCLVKFEVIYCHKNAYFNKIMQEIL